MEIIKFLEVVFIVDPIKKLNQKNQSINIDNQIMLHLLNKDIIATILSWIHRYDNINDSTVTLFFLKYTSQNMNTLVTLRPQLNLKRFLEKLLLSDIYNLAILDWFSDLNVIPYLEIIKYTIKCNNLGRLQSDQSNGCI